MKAELTSSNNVIKAVIVIITCLLGVYFVQTYLRHEEFKNNLGLIKDIIPDFFSRFRSLMLSYALLREKVISNNSLAMFETIPVYD